MTSQTAIDSRVDRVIDPNVRRSVGPEIGSGPTAIPPGGHAATSG